MDILAAERQYQHERRGEVSRKARVQESQERLAEPSTGRHAAHTQARRQCRQRQDVNQYDGTAEGSSEHKDKGHYLLNV